MEEFDRLLISSKKFKAEESTLRVIENAHTALLLCGADTYSIECITLVVPIIIPIRESLVILPIRLIE